jgi:hypothetical protein
MQNVYRFASFTISAAHSNGSSSGCIQSRNGHLGRSIPFANQMDKAGTLNWYLQPEQPDFDLSIADADKEPLYRRGWVLQEQLLY